MSDAQLKAIVTADINPFVSSLKAAKDQASGFGDALKGIGTIATAGLTVPIVAGFAAAIGAASKYQDAVTQLDTVLKSTANTTKDATDAGGHWAVTTDLSQKAAAKLETQIKSTSDSIANITERTQLMGKETKSTAVTLQMKTEKLTALNTELAKGTTAQKVWVSGVQAGTAVEQMSKQALLNMAEALSGTTKFSRDTVISTEALELTFTSIGKNVMPQATQAILDMSQALGQDTKSSAIQLGKALQDPIKGVTALHRVGVEFNDQQKLMIANMVKAGNVEGAQKEILKELTKEFGGSADAAGKTFSGALDILNNKFQEFLATVGTPIITMITPIFTMITSAVTGLTQAWSGLDSGMQTGILAILGVVAAIGPLMMIMGALASPIGLVVAAIAGLYLAYQTNFGGIRDFVTKVVADVKPLVQGLGDIVNAAVDAMNPAATKSQSGPQRAMDTSNNRNAGRNDPKFKPGQSQVADDGTFADKFAQNMQKYNVPPAVLTGLQTLSSALGALGPGGTAAAAIGVVNPLAGALTLLYTVITNFKSISMSGPAQDIRNSLSPIFDVVNNVGIALAQIPIRVAIFSIQIQAFFDSLKTGFQNIVGSLTTSFVNFKGPDIKGAISSGIDDAILWIQTIGHNLLGAHISKMIRDAAKNAGDAIGQISTSIQAGIQAALVWIKGSGATLAGAAATAFANAISGVLKGVGSALVGALKAALLTLAKMFGALPLNLGGGISATLTAAASIGSATGGNEIGGIPRLVGENGPELFIPQSNGRIMSNNSLKGMGSSGGNNITIQNLTVNGVQDASSLLDEIQKVAGKRNLQVGY